MNPKKYSPCTSEIGFTIEKGDLAAQAEVKDATIKLIDPANVVVSTITPRLIARLTRQKANQRLTDSTGKVEDHSG